MINVNDIKVSGNSSFTNTGSPHHVEVVTNLANVKVVEKGREIINNYYQTEGCNINFVEQLNNETFKVRTYERGVEDETLSCGTGVTAVALAMFDTKQTTSSKVYLKTKGGDLSVSFVKKENTYTNIVLSGPATQVYKGIWEL